MAAITATAVGQGPAAPTVTTLTASDTLTYNPQKRQLLVLENTTASPVVVTVDGSTGTTQAVPGYGSVDVSAGKAITVAANGYQYALLSTISAFLSGTVAVTGGVGVKAMLFEVA
jgi:uncharacterized protein YjiK